MYPVFKNIDLVLACLYKDANLNSKHFDYLQEISNKKFSEVGGSSLTKL